MLNQFNIMSTKMNSSAENLRNFLSGIELRLDAAGFRLKVFSTSRLITKNNIQHPFLFLEIDQIQLNTKFINMNEKNQLSILTNFQIKLMKIGENCFQNNVNLISRLSTIKGDKRNQMTGDQSFSQSNIQYNQTNSQK